MSTPSAAAPPDASLFDRRQAVFWERDESYQPPESPTAVASARPKIEWLQAQLQLPRSSRVLDVGAGNGVFTTQLLAYFDSVVSLDGAWNMIARNPSPQGRLMASAYELPFANESFDLVFCGNLLHHLADPERAVREMRRVSRRHVAFCEPNILNLPLLVFMAAVPEERGGVKFSRGYLRRLASSAGLLVTHCASMGLVYERKTPEFCLPWLKAFDRPWPFGAYTVLLGSKRATS